MLKPLIKLCLPLYLCTRDRPLIVMKDVKHYDYAEVKLAHSCAKAGSKKSRLPTRTSTLSFLGSLTFCLDSVYACHNGLTKVAMTCAINVLPPIILRYTTNAQDCSHPMAITY
jgi:hypothetical protein